MTKDYLTIDGVQYRTEINMNTAEEWERRSGKKLGQFEIEAAQSVKKGGVATRAMLIWIYCAIIEGEEIEGRVFDIDFIAFKRMVKPSIMTAFAPIFIKQYIGAAAPVVAPVDKESVKKKSLIRSVYHYFGRWHWAKWVGVLLILAFAGLYISGRLSGV